jgi:hypothetical protein
MTFPRPVMAAKKSATFCASHSARRASITHVFPWNRRQANKFSRAIGASLTSGTGSVPSVPTDEKRPAVNALETQQFRRFRDVGTLGTRFPSHDTCAQVRMRGRASERARLCVRARAAVPTVPTSQSSQSYRDINKVRLGRFYSVGTLGTLCLRLASFPVCLPASGAIKILPENQRDRVRR